MAARTRHGPAGRKIGLQPDIARQMRIEPQPAQLQDLLRVAHGLQLLAQRVVERIAGATRTETARLVAEEALARGASAEVVWLATAAAFPDGLVAGAAAATEGGVLLLVDRDALPADAPAAAFLAAHREALSRIRIAGGVAAVSAAVLEAVTALLIP